jgi:hypothetical protein
MVILAALASAPRDDAAKVQASGDISPSKVTQS